MKRPGTRRIFFALWPDETVRAAIIARRARIGGLSRRRVPDANLHLTLLFLGDQEAGAIERVIEAADDPGVAPFELSLDRLGWFARSRVAWLGGPPAPAGRRLVGVLDDRMTELGLDYSRRAWAPHVTLFRSVRSRPRFPRIEPLNWPVRAYSLIESVPGKPYQVLRTWALESGPEDSSGTGAE